MPDHQPPKTQSPHGKKPRTASARLSRKRPAFQLEELEPRLLFSADLAPLALLGASTAANDTPQATASPSTPPPISIQQLVALPAAAPEITRHELIFVDGGIDHLDQLVADLQQRQPGVQLVVIDPQADGLGVITETLRNTRGLDAVHVLSHGNEHGLQLGGTFLDSATLHARAQEVAGWSTSFRAGADLMLYGCDLAAGVDGQALATGLGLLTGTDVAASTDLTGNAMRGGDWSLEYETGLIQAHVALDGQGLWQGTLGIATVGNETLVHTATGATSETTTTNKQMAADSSGNFVAVWQNGSAIEGQRFFANGTANGAKFTISSSGTPSNAQVAMNASGSFVVVWNDASNNLYFQRYHSGGVALGGATTVIASTQTTGNGALFTPPYWVQTTSGQNATVGINTAGDFVVTYRLNTTRIDYWDPTHTAPTGTTTVSDSIAFKAYTSTGATQGTNASGTVSTAVLAGTSPAIAMNGAGAFVISWSDASNNVSARLYSAARAAVTAGGDVTGGGGGSQSSVAISDSGNYVVAYNDAGIINYRLYSSAGAATSAVTQANANPPGTTPSASRANPSVAMTGTGEFAIAWENTGQDGSGTGVYLRQFSSTGVAVRSDIQVATSTSGAQRNASLAYKGTQVTTLWNGNGTQTGAVDSQGVFFQRYTVTTGLSAPGNITTTAAALAYTENQAATAVDNALILAPDPDGDFYSSATVSISAGFVTGQDVLAFTNQNGITGTFNATTGVMSLTGSSSIANYQAALRSITYVNTSEKPNTAARTTSFVVNDGNANSNTATRNITVTAVNDAPVVSATAAALAYTENQAATAVDTGLTVSDVDSTNLTSATVSISANFASGQDVLAFVNQNGISGSYNATSGVLTLTGSATLANYQAALRSITYSNTSDKPSTNTRTVTFLANDGGASNNTGSASRNITITAVNDAPVVSTTGTSLSYTENQAATAIDTGLTVSDVDSANLTGATVSVSANFASGQDVLAFTNQNGITGSYNATSGVLTLTGTSSVANYQAALRSITYANSSDNPSTNARTVTFVVNDGSASNNTGSGARNITITAVNDAPVLTTTGAALGYTENQAATAIDTGLSVSDADSTNLTSATVSISANFAVGQDVLAFVNQNGISGSYNATTGVLSLTGSATVANYQAALRSVTYVNTSDTPSTSTRTITFAVNDGSASNNTASATRNITLTAVNDAPVVTTTGTALSYTENQAATAIETALTLSDVDSTNLTAATITISSNFASGQDVLAFVNQNGISGTFNSSSGVLTLTGSATVANYQSALRSITYVNTSESPSSLTRTVTFSVNDGSAINNTGSATRNISVTNVNDAPVITTTGTALAYTENQAATAIDPALALSDVDSTTLSSATVSLSSGFASGQDVLAFANQNGITGTYNASTGVLSLSGVTSLANYQTALRSVTYANTSDNPSTPTRTVTFLVNDGNATNNTASGTRNITVAAVNDAPVISSNGAGGTATTSVAENTTAVTTVLATDPDNVSLTYSIVNTGDGGRFSINATTGVLTFIAAPDFENPTDADLNNSYVVTVRASDGSLTGSQTITVNVTDVVSTLIVDTTADTDDTSLGTSFNAEALNASKGTDGKISLREALIAANNTSGTDTIRFNISGVAGTHGEYTITMASSLPTILDAIVIDGSTQSGYSTHPLIVLDGNGGAADALNFSGAADASTVRGLVIRNFSGDGIRIQAGADNLVVAGNYIGSFNADGSDAGSGKRNAGSGIESYGANLTIGGTTAADRNVISGNASAYNVYLGNGASGSTVKGNFLGTTATGSSLVASNSTYGLMVETAAANVTIGGTATGAGNVISGFTNDGLWLSTSGTTTVQGNHIGTNAAGTAALANGRYGIFLDDTGSSLIGGTTAGAGNLISGNTSGGIYATNSGSVTVQGNTIGLNALGNAALANGGFGIRINTGSASTIGGNTAAARNIISGNASHGLWLDSASSHVVKGNYIGVAADGSTLIGNLGDGIRISTNNQVIGGKAVGDGNIIAGNGGAGINVTAGVGNLFYRNAIYSNTQLGIDLGNDGVTLNDVNDGDGGANYLNNFPVITSVVTTGSSTVISGSIDGAQGPDNIYIELYSSPSKDASGYGEGRTYLGSVLVSTTAGTGDATFSLTVTGVAVGDWVTAIANVETSYIGASEFSKAVQAVTPANGPRGKLIWNNNDQFYQQYVDWSNAGFGDTGVNGMNFGDDITMLASAEAPSRNEIIFIGSADVSGKILAGIWTGSSWSSVLSVPLASPSSTASQFNSFAVTYDKVSGDAMLVWDNGSNTGNGLSYATWNGISWSAVQTMALPITGEPVHMQLATSPNSSEMVLVVSTNAGSNNQCAMVWDGSAWGNAQALGTNTHQSFFEVNVAFEQLSGRAMVLYDNALSDSPDVQYQIWNGSTWSGEQTVSAPGSITASNELRSMVMAADPSSNRLALAAKDDHDNVWMAVWNGTAWTDQIVATTTGVPLLDNHPTMALAFESQSGDLLAAYGKATGPSVYFRTWSSGGGWSSEAAGPSMGASDVPNIVKLYADPYSNGVMLGVQDNAQDLSFTLWDGSAWGTPTVLDSNTGETYRENFSFVWYVNVPTITNLDGDALDYYPGDGAVPIDQGIGAAVVAGDPQGYTAGQLNVSFGSGGFNAEDVLGILDQGTGTGQIGLSGANVSFGGVIIGTWSGGSNGTPLSISLNASATDAAVSALISQVTYQNTNAGMLNAGARQVRFVVTNASGKNSAQVDTTVQVKINNLAPVVTTTGSALNHTENQPPQAIDPGLALSDLDGSTLSGASVSIGSGFASGEDVLGYVDQNGITGSYNASTGVLTLTGTASLANYQSALSSVTYFNTSDNPSTTTRTITFTANDGSAVNNIGTASRNVTVTATADASVVTTSATVLVYNENQGAVPIDAALTINDVDSTTLASATVRINAGFAPAEDLLAFVNQNGITGNYNGSTGVLSLTGVATVAQYEAALRSVAYTNTSDAPSTTIRVIGVTVNDGTQDSAQATRQLAINSINDAPTVQTTVAGLVCTENTGAQALDTGLTLSDVDSTTLSGATVSISGHFVSGEDLLTFVDQNGITGSYNANTGVLTLSGVASLTDYQSALRSVSYTNTSDNPDTTTRAVTFVVDDGSASQATGFAGRSVNITAVNDAPTISTSGGDMAYAENSGAQIVDPGISLADVDSLTLSGATISIGNGFATGEDTLTFVNQSGITGSYNANTGVLSLSGVATLADYENALSSVTYSNSSNTPSAAKRTVTFAINDGSGANALASASRDIAITAINDAPIVVTSAPPVAYTEQQGPVLVDPALTLSDVDSTTLVGASVAISSGQQAGQDILIFVDQNGITGTFDALAGVLTLSGNASVAQYEAALRSVSFRNDSDAPGTTTRTLTFTVDDGSVLNAVSSSSRDLQVTAVNDAPLLGLNATPLSYLENNAGLAVDATLALTDNDSATISGATVAIGSGFDASQDQLLYVTAGSITASYNSSTGVLTASGTGTLAEYQAFLRSVSYVNLSDAPGTATRTVSVSVDDGSGINATATANRDIQITAVNDAPVITANALALSYTEGDGTVVIDSSITVSDVDSSTLVGATVQLSDNYTPGQGLLGFVTQSGITGSFDSGSGTLTLSGNATVAQYQAVLRSVTYTNISDNPSTSTRTVTFTVSDGGAVNAVGAAARHIDVTAVNDAPVLILTPAPLLYTENDGAVPIDASLSLTDIDSPTLVGATVRIGTGLSTAEDLLSFQNQNGISASYDLNTGVLTLSGTASVAQYEAALRSVSYLNLSELPSTATRTVTITVDDGSASQNTFSASRDIQLVSINDSPVVTVDSSTLSYLENQGSVAVDGSLTLADADSLTLVSATVRISQGFAGVEDVLGFVNQNGIAGSYNASTGVLTFTGTATLADYEASLRLVTYTNTSLAPSAATRTLSISVDDGGISFAVGSASRDVAVTPINDAPTVITGSTPLNYQENQTATAIDAGLQLQDIDSPTLVGASVRIDNFVIDQDRLVFTGQNGITGAFNPEAGVLNLTGVATAAQYQAALRSVGYVNSSDNPDTTQRHILITVDDGNAFNHITLATSTIDVSAINDAPQIDAPQALQLTQGQSVSLSDRWVVLDPDSDHQAMTYTLLTGPGQGQLFMGSALLDTGSSFTQADLSAGLITYRHNGLGTGADLLQLTAVDAQGASLSGGALTLNLQVSTPPASSGSVAPGGVYVPPSTIVDAATPASPDIGNSNASSNPPAKAPEKTPPASPKPVANTATAQGDPSGGNATRVSARMVNGSTDMAYAAPKAASYQLIVNGTQGLVRTNFDLALQIVQATVNNMATAGLSVVPHLSIGSDHDLVQKLNWDIPSSDYQLPLVGHVSAKNIEASGIALTVGAVWWISRGATLLGSLLLSTPIWRSIDPLPVFATGTQDDEDPDTQTHDDAVAEQMFNDAASPHADELVIG